MTQLVRVGDILAILDRLAPQELAETWDHVGLQVGASDQGVTRVLVTLEMSAAVERLLADGEPTLVVSHHPLLFRPLDRVRTDQPVGRDVAALLRAGAALVACHTNWDKAPGGTDDTLARALGLEGVVPLMAAHRALYRLSVMVPEDDLDDVREALAAAGAGESGRYRRASFSVHGESTFESKPGAHPAYGAVGGLTVRGEHRLEMVVDEDRLAAATRALITAHPYEEPAFGIDRLHEGRAFGGLGRIGAWPEETSVDALADTVRARLHAPGTRVSGAVKRAVQRIACVGGSGRSLLEAATRAGADALVTADIGHHDARLAEALGIAVVDAGHRETEEPGVRTLCDPLSEGLCAHGESVEVTFVPVSPVFGWRT